MVKKILLFSGIVIVALVALGVAGFVYAQTQTPPATDDWFGCGRVGKGGGFGFGRGACNFGEDAQGGLLHSYMLEAWAEAFNMTAEDLQERLDDGGTIWDIAEENGLSQQEFFDMVPEVRTKAIEAALADGVITQEQADWLLNHLGRMWGRGFKGGPCHGGSWGPGRWKAPPAESESQG